MLRSEHLRHTVRGGQLRVVALAVGHAQRMHLVTLFARERDGDGRIHAAGDQHDGLAEEFVRHVLHPLRYDRSPAGKRL